MPETTQTLRLTASSRPFRVAFLVDPLSLPPEAFDSLIVRCMAAWGGGFWPIIPTDGDSISKTYWSLLSLTDPDFITSTVEVSEKLRMAIETLVAPAHFEVVPIDPTSSHPVVRTDWPVAPMASTGVFAHHHRQAHLFSSNDPLIWFRERYIGGRDRPEYPARRFVQRNFGYPENSWPLEHELKQLPFREILLEGKRADEILDEIKEGPGLYYRFLCRKYAPRPFRADYLKSPAHAIVVGDSVGEALRAWNRFVTSHPSGRVIWLPETLATDEPFINAFRSWAQRQLSWRSQGPHGILIESATVEVERLSALTEALGSDQSVTVKSFDPWSLAFSGREPWSTQAWGGPGSRLPRLTTTTTTLLTGTEAAIAPVVPPLVVPASQGTGWMVDLDMDDSITDSQYSNTTPRWRLPRRSNLVAPFLSRGPQLRASRVARGHFPSVGATAEAPTLEVRIPDPWAVAHALLCTEPRTNSTLPRIRRVSLSEQGRRFRAAVDLFDGIYRAGGYLTNLFWREQFLRAAGDPVESRGTQVAIARRILAARGDQSDEAFAFRLASQLNRTARKKGDALSRKQLGAAYSRAVNRAYSGTPKRQRPSFKEDGWPDFEWLVGRGVFLQGADLRCPTCGLSRWHPVDLLARTVQCPECLNTFALPTDPGWSYRLNGLIRAALADDAVLPVIEATYAIAREARTHAHVWPPVDLRETYDADAFTDLDLFVLRDGELVVGEVKSSASGFDDGQLITLATVASAVSADEIVLAAPVQTWDQTIETHVARVLNDALPTPISIRILQLESDPWI